jgi:hypothetical protein
VYTEAQVQALVNELLDEAEAPFAHWQEQSNADLIAMLYNEVAILEESQLDDAETEEITSLIRDIAAELETRLNPADYEAVLNGIGWWSYQQLFK